VTGAESDRDRLTIERLLQLAHTGER